jgi:hypothetical protein
MTYSRWLPQTWSHTEEYRFGRSLLVYDLALRGCARTQPQRDVGRLHGLPYHPYQVGVQRLQVCLIPQSGGELFERLPRVVRVAEFAHRLRELWRSSAGYLVYRSPADLEWFCGK